ncbi:alpha/beta fold hydrolase [Pukyongiella litopenaei]|uniref:Alpha/beta fold hydrolase n=1 Tax=Pukyongiella litopenaei TaxID=2605946 RepID=A0A2S0MT85_9RHOB|nr:alpha/beta fold hydrolase [Pukyongiella litopenaei]AVO38941.1 alpha/beta fold hydrolase [Pukyongiella litopenaei]
MPGLRLADVTLHYEIGGNGPPLLLIAGMASDSASWLPLLPLLEPRFTVIRPDNRSTGRTTPWEAPTGPAINAADCAALLAHLGLGPAHVLSHSMGGLIALQLGMDAPEAVASLTLAASAPMRLQRNSAIFRNLVAIRRSDAPPDTWLRALYPWLFDPAAFDDPAALDAAAAAALVYPHGQSADAMDHQLRALDRFDPSGLRVAHPAQAILGGRDLLIPEAPARAALAALGDVPVHLIADAGHSIHWDAPHAVTDHLTMFIDALSG